jgi:hypothetical protein
LARTSPARAVSIADWSRASVAAVTVVADGLGEAADASLVDGLLLGGELSDELVDELADELAAAFAADDTVRNASDSDLVSVSIAFDTLCCAVDTAS